MPRYGRLLTDAQWEKIQPLLPKRPKRPQGGRPPMTAKCWKAFCGFCAAGPAGRICRMNSRTPRRAGGGCGTGRSKAPG